LQIQVNGQEISGHYILAVASNIHLYAGGIAEISPAARLDDGQMDLWLFTGATWLEAVTHAWNLYSGQHVRSEQARCIPFCEASISSNTLLYVQLDGEPIEGINQVILSVQPRALKVLVPEKAPRTLFLD
jgi:diacylglycerol kinase family enzyme